MRCAGGGASVLLGCVLLLGPWTKVKDMSNFEVIAPLMDSFSMRETKATGYGERPGLVPNGITVAKVQAWAHGPHFLRPFARCFLFARHLLA